MMSEHLIDESKYVQQFIFVNESCDLCNTLNVVFALCGDELHDF